MARPQRLKLALVSVALLCLLGGLLGGVFYVWNRGRSRSFLESAHAAIARRDFVAAAEHLARHLAKKPGDAEADLLAAQVARRRGDSETFFRHLEGHKQCGGPALARSEEFALYQVQLGDLSGAVTLLAQRTSGGAAQLVREALIEGALVNLRRRDGRAGSLPAGPEDPAVILASRCQRLADRGVRSGRGGTGLDLAGADSHSGGRLPARGRGFTNGLGLRSGGPRSPVPVGTLDPLGRSRRSGHPARTGAQEPALGSRRTRPVSERLPIGRPRRRGPLPARVADGP